MLLFLVDLINIENLRISFGLFYLLSFLILLLFVAELHHKQVGEKIVGSEKKGARDRRGAKWRVLCERWN